MRHLKKGRIFSRPSNQRRALLISLASSLVVHGQIRTTLAKAKETSRFLEKLITTAKKNNLATRRNLLKFFPPMIVEKIMKDILPQLANRKGGYTKVLHLNPRKSDGAKMAIIRLATKK